MATKSCVLLFSDAMLDFVASPRLRLPTVSLPVSIPYDVVDAFADGPFTGNRLEFVLWSSGFLMRSCKRSRQKTICQKLHSSCGRVIHSDSGGSLRRLKSACRDLYERPHIPLATGGLAGFQGRPDLPSLKEGILPRLISNPFYLACTDVAGDGGPVSVRAISAHPVPMAEIHWSWS